MIDREQRRRALAAMHQAAARIGRDPHDLSRREYRLIRTLGADGLPPATTISTALGGWQRARELSTADRP